MSAAKTGARLIRSTILFLSICFVSCELTCVYKDISSGKTFDLRPLIASNGSYTWTQNVTSYSYNSQATDDPVTMYFQLQICRNVETQLLPKKCNDTGALYSYNAKDGCVTCGSADVAAFDLNPYKDGVFLQLYHGSKVNNWSKYSSNIYFVCNANVTMSQPMFEHIKTDINQAHFKIFTKYAC